MRTWKAWLVYLFICLTLEGVLVYWMIGPCDFMHPFSTNITACEE